MGIEWTSFWGRREKHVYVSRRVETLRGPLRYVHKIIEGRGGVLEVKQKSGVVLAKATGERFQLEARLYEDDGAIPSLTFQKFNKVGGPHKELHFTFYGGQIVELLRFLKDITKLYFPSAEGFRVADSDLAASTLTRQQLKALLVDNKDMLAAVVESDLSLQDVLGMADRKRQLAEFARLLSDQTYRNLEAQRLGGPEKVWQDFFERNTWIFGYGLSYISLTNLDGKALRQRVAGFSLVGPGKEADGLMKTQALISSLCFVEIKHPDTELTTRMPYRPGVYGPSPELAGATSQVQVGVSRALEELGSVYRPRDGHGRPTGEELHQFSPRSFLVIGSLDEFQEEHGPHPDRFRSFELFRRGLQWPEVITFDELYARARFIVEGSSTRGTIVNGEGP
jgi:hypothetical protein